MVALTPNRSPNRFIALRGVRHNNLKNFDLDLPVGKLVVITGLSGSGKSSLAFDTLFAEGQRRYVETFSPYARQFFDRMDKPKVDSIEGIPPAIAIEQRNSVKTTRSTVGTMTEICDYMKALWPHVAGLFCPGCGRRVHCESPQLVWKAVESDSLQRNAEAPRFLVSFTLALTEKLSVAEMLDLIGRQGYRRILIPEDKTTWRVRRLEEAAPELTARPPRSVIVVQDRVSAAPRHRARFIEACEQAYHFGKGRLSVWDSTGETAAHPRPFSRHLHCAACDREFPDPTPARFSFNHPIGACPECRGFGRIITIDYRKAMPDHSRTLAEGVVKPWRTGHGRECQDDLLKFCRRRRVPVDVPFDRLSRTHQDWVIHGDPDYGKDSRHEWPNAWYGVKGYFRWLESKSYKMHVRVLLSRYRAYTECPVCRGTRFRPETLQYRAPAPAGWPRPANQDLTLADFYHLPLHDALSCITVWTEHRRPDPHDPAGIAFAEVRARLEFLTQIGLGYLTLDRPTRSLSGGETQRVNLTTCLGSRLVNTLFVLDEPSIGLHPTDTDRLIRLLHQLREAGNTIVVVEHEEAVIRAADSVVDLGPGHGECGGRIVFQGTPRQLLRSRRSLTGQYLSGRESIPLPHRRPVTLRSHPCLQISGATVHNLKDLQIDLPLHRFVCLTGVSGSGKSTLLQNVLLPLLRDRIEAHRSADNGEDPHSDEPSASAHLSGGEFITDFVSVDQSLPGKTPRSTPVLYIGAFDPLRELFARTERARQHGLKASAFSFNSPQGQCERCRGVGFEKIEMQFLSDVFIKCPECNGNRYRPHILEITLTSGSGAAWSIADWLEATVDEGIEFLAHLPPSRHRDKAAKGLELLQEIGLGYLRIGQPINTLSGGESQRLKLIRHLAEHPAHPEPRLFLLDEPTTGLHFHDVQLLLNLFQRLVDAGHSVCVIEHNLEVIKCADWIIDLGPGAGDEGGKLVAAGPPEAIAIHTQSRTGIALKPLLPAP